MVKPSPKRGEIYWVDFSPGRGSEQQGLRPALIVQNDVGNQYAPTVIVVAITSQDTDKQYPTDVVLPKSVLPRPSKLLCSQILTLSKARLGKRIAVLDTPIVKQVDQALKRSLNLS